jgi:TolA-binding protein
VPARLLADYQFSRANTLMEKGNFEASLKENDEVFKKYPEILGAQAFFNQGLIHAHPLNPERDYGKAAASFQTVLETFPESPLKEMASIWAATVQGIMDREKEIDGLKQKARLLDAEREEADRRIKVLTDAGRKETDKKIKALTDAERRNEEEIGGLRDRILELNTRISDLMREMEMLKKVDIGIAEKKRKTLR